MGTGYEDLYSLSPHAVKCSCCDLLLGYSAKGCSILGAIWCRSCSEVVTALAECLNIKMRSKFDLVLDNNYNELGEVREENIAMATRMERLVKSIVSGTPLYSD